MCCKEEEEEKNPPDSLAAMSLMTFAKTIGDMNDREINDLPKRSLSASFGHTLSPGVEPCAGECAGGMLFELVSIHARILALEQQAASVPVITAELKHLSTQLLESKQREAGLTTQLEDLRRNLRVSEEPPTKRPRIVSMDEAN